MQVSANQGIINKLEGMVIQNKTPNLLSLLKSHVGDATPEVPIDSRPPTFIPALSFLIEPSEKKRERGREREREREKVEQGGFRGRGDLDPNQVH